MKSGCHLTVCDSACSYLLPPALKCWAKRCRTTGHFLVIQPVVRVETAMSPAQQALMEVEELPYKDVRAQLKVLGLPAVG